jgi:hypothetical protein
MLRHQLSQTRGGRPMHFLVTGERGIGKSSLLNHVRTLACDASDGLPFLVINAELSPGTTTHGLLQKIEYELRQELAKSEKTRTAITGVWEFVQRVEAAGVKISTAANRDELVLEEFSDWLAHTAIRLTSQADRSRLDSQFCGIVILLDEADKGGQASLGATLKLLTERLQRRACHHVMFGLAGLPELSAVIAASHPSALRIFEELRLDRLEDAEVIEVIDACMDRANSENARPTTITLGARDTLINLSEGYPHFIQQFGFSAFAADDDDVLDHDDVVRGALGERGALELIGDRYYHDPFYNQIQTDVYRQVLRIMSDHLDDWVTKDSLRAKFRGRGSTLDSALKALRDRQIIPSKIGERGVYRLQHKAFALWIRLISTNDAELRRELWLGATVRDPRE